MTRLLVVGFAIVLDDRTFIFESRAFVRPRDSLEAALAYILSLLDVRESSTLESDCSTTVIEKSG